MTYNIITTQPNIYDSFLKTGLIARGIDKKIIQVNIESLYDYATDAHRSIDDSPYGGGAGMILRVDVMDKAISKIQKSKIKDQKVAKKSRVVLLTPQGKQFSQRDAKRLAKSENLVLISGRFEGYDERIRSLVDEEISIGDYVLTSGDLPAMVLIDAISRQIPGFIDRKESIIEESFSPDFLTDKRLPLLEYPQYTRPLQYQGKSVPEILLSGNHQEIAKWRQEKAVRKTEKAKKIR